MRLAEAGAGGIALDRFPEPLTPLSFAGGGHRIVEPDDEIDRFPCRIRWRDGSVRNRYERLGGSLVQTYYALMDFRGVERIEILDLVSDSCVVATVWPPEGTVVEIYHANAWSDGGSVRITNVGWREPRTGHEEWAHARGGATPHDPAVVWADTKRSPF